MKKMLITLLITFPLVGYGQWEDNDEEEPEDEIEIYEIFDVSVRAEFIGGDTALVEFIDSALVYPQAAIHGGIEAAAVHISFVINEDSTISDVESLGTKKGYGLEQEAIRVILATSRMWTPAFTRDRPVPMRFRMPIDFILKE